MATFVNDFLSHFHVFVDLSLVVCSIAIRNIKTRWITYGIDELWGGFIENIARQRGEVKSASRSLK